MFDTKIQFQDTRGAWFTVQTVRANENIVKNALDVAEQTYRGKRVRAVDKAGNIVDLRNALK